MDEENKNLQNNGPENYGGRMFAYIAVGLIIAGGIALGLSFTVLGIYALIASILLEFSAMTFINVQKKKNDFKWLIYIKIAAYVVFIAAIIVFVGGTIYSSQK